MNVTSSLWRDAAARWRKRTERAEAERDAAQAALARVEELHEDIGDDESGWHFCIICEETWPCATIRTIKEENTNG